MIAARGTLIVFCEVRTRNSRLYAGLAYDAKTFQDKRPLNLDMPVEDKKAQVLMASLRGDHRDQLGGGGVSGLSLTWSTGNIDLQTPGLRLAGTSRRWTAP